MPQGLWPPFKFSQNASGSSVGLEVFSGNAYTTKYVIFLCLQWWVCVWRKIGVDLPVNVSSKEMFCALGIELCPCLAVWFLGEYVF